MNEKIVICSHGFLNASLVPAELLGPPGKCPAGVYETILYDDGRLVDWRRHLGRFHDSVAFLGIATSDECQFDLSEIKEILARNGLSRARARVRLMAFQDQQTSDAGSAFRFMALCSRIDTAVAIGESTGSFRCVISRSRRAANDLAYNHKRLGRGEAEDELAVAVGRDFDDVIFLNDREEICEAVYSNVWLLENGELYTPPIDSPCLPGITRRRISEAARRLNISVHTDKPLSLSQLENADAIFLSSSVRGIQRVDQVENIWKRHADRARTEKLLSALRDEVGRVMQESAIFL